MIIILFVSSLFFGFTTVSRMRLGPEMSPVDADRARTCRVLSDRIGPRVNGLGRKKGGQVHRFPAQETRICGRGAAVFRS